MLSEDISRQNEKSYVREIHLNWPMILWISDEIPLPVKLTWQWTIVDEIGNTSSFTAHFPIARHVSSPEVNMTQHLPPAKKTTTTTLTNPADFPSVFFPPKTAEFPRGSGLQTTKAFLILAFNALENLKKLLRRHGPVIRQCRQSWWISQNQNSPLKPTIQGV